MIFCGTGFAWHKSNLEDFADFYLTGIHRGDDPFALMEQHHIKKEKIKLRRNIGHFAFLRRHIEKPETEEFHFPIRARAWCFRRPSSWGRLHPDWASQPSLIRWLPPSC